MSWNSFGEVDQPGAGAGGLVGLVDAQLGGEEQVAGRLDMLRAQAFVLLPVDKPLRLLGRPLGFVQAQLADHPLDQALLVVAVEDLEVFRQLGFLPVRAQQAMGQAVKGANPHALGADAHQLLDAVTHLGGGFVGKGHRQHRVQRGVFHRHQPGNAVHQYAGFAGASAGEHQLTTQRGCYSLALGVVEGIQQGGEVIMHGAF